MLRAWVICWRWAPESREYLAKFCFMSEDSGTEWSTPMEYLGVGEDADFLRIIGYWKSEDIST
jgi:hypothetical protein